MTLGTRVAVMRSGTVQQVDTPQTLYRAPANLFVAAFIGSPSMNLVEAELDGDAVEFAGFRDPARRGPPTRRPLVGPRDRRHPPAGLRARRASGGDLPHARGRGGRRRGARLGDPCPVPRSMRRRSTSTPSAQRATRASVATLLATDRRALFTAEVSEGTKVRPGEKITLALDPSRIHFFDPASGENLARGAAEPVAAPAWTRQTLRRSGARGRTRRSRPPRRRSSATVRRTFSARSTRARRAPRRRPPA